MSRAFLLESVEKAKKYDDLYSILRNSLSTANVGVAEVRILILNAPCNGFGDLVFAWKLAKIVRYMYPESTVKIASTQPDKLLMLGVNRSDLFRLATSDSKRTQCRKYTLLRMVHMDKDEEVDTSQFDLFFDAPVTADNSPDLHAVRRLIPTATRFNTFSFSEYNDSLKKGFDFNMGVGEGRDGLLLLPPRLLDVTPRADIMALIKPQHFGSEYALMYINTEYDDYLWKPCTYHFLRMIAVKYGESAVSRFQVVLPAALIQKCKLRQLKVCKRLFGDVFDRVVIVQKDRDNMRIDMHDEGSKTMYLRCDVFPVQNKVMVGLMRYSVKDVLITGDQSLTDVLNCCPDKNIFYQAMPWKANLARQLAIHMPNKYLMHRKSSCGTVDAIKYKSNYARFVQSAAFHKLAKDKLDSIVAQAGAARASPRVRAFMHIVERSRTLQGVLTQLEETLQ